MDPSTAATLREALEGQAGLELAFLFGSHATGREHEGSDVDLAIRARGVALLEVARRVSLAVGLEVDVVDLDAVGYPLLREIVEQGVLVAESSAGAAARWRAHALVDLETDRPWFERMRDGYLARAAGNRGA